FRRKDALALKDHFERKKYPTSVIYGGLPPQVRKTQAQRFASGETILCVATDAIGMGMNLPAQRVCFTTLKKFDGSRVRKLYPSEIKQIAGRAGRFGKHESGIVSALNKEDLQLVQAKMTHDVHQACKARIAPSIIELEILEGRLYQRLQQWRNMTAIPDDYLALLHPMDLKNHIRLAQRLPPSYEQIFGLRQSYVLCSAPVNERIEDFWLDCVGAITNRNVEALQAQLEYLQPVTLAQLEYQIKAAELFLWLSQREDFQAVFTNDVCMQVQRQKAGWIEKIERILKRKKQKNR
ncbi:MAG: helicase-related protein, partial [Myxococcota bacterium]